MSDNPESKKDKTSKKPGAKNLREAALDSVNNSLRKVYYFTSFSSMLLKIVNQRKVKENASKRKKTETDLLYSIERLISEWRDYLLWTHKVLEQLNSILGKKEAPPSLFKKVLLYTKDLVPAFLEGESTLTFVVISKILLSTMFGRYFGSARLTRFFGEALLNFMFSRFETIMPTLEDQTKSINTLLGDSSAYFKRPLFDYWNQVKEEMQSNNPELYATLEKQVDQISPILQVPTYIFNTAAGVVNFSKNQVKKLQPTLLPLMEDVLEISYKAFRLSYGRIRKYYGDDPLKVFSSLKEDSWASEFVKSVQVLFGQQKPKVDVSKGEEESNEDDKDRTSFKPSKL